MLCLFVGKSFLEFGEGLSPLVFRFTPSALEGIFARVARWRYRLLRGVEGESCEGTIGASWCRRDSAVLWSFCDGRGGMDEEKSEDSARERKNETKFETGYSWNDLS